MPRNPPALPALVALCLCSLAAPGIAQDSVLRSIEPITAHVYRALDNNHRTVFMVTDEGIIYYVDLALLRQLAVAAEVQVHPDTDPILPPEVWFEEWRDGRKAFGDFSAAAQDAP